MTDFGLAYLAASHLIDADGRPVGLAGLVSHLFWTEPANFALVRLLSLGAVHRLVAEVQGQQQLQEALLLVVAGLFERVPLHPLEARHWQGSSRHESASVVVLPSLPSAVSAIIEQHNDQVLQLLVATLKQHAAQHTPTLAAAPDSGGLAADTAELTLPLSGCCFSSASTAASGICPCPGTSTAPDVQSMSSSSSSSSSSGGRGIGGGSSRGTSALLKTLGHSVVASTLTSPFMALCGRGDVFSSLSELLLAGKQWLRLHRGGVPLVALQDRRGQELHLNAWALDYFKHGQKSELVRSNGMLEGDAFTKLKSMSGVLAAISLSLQQAVEGELHSSTQPVQQQQQQQQRAPPPARSAYGRQQNAAQRGWPVTAVVAQPPLQANHSHGGSDMEGGEQQSNLKVAEAFQALSEAFTAKFRVFNTGGVVVHGAANVASRK